MRKLTTIQRHDLLDRQIDICEEYFELVQAWIEQTSIEASNGYTPTPRERMVAHFLALITRHHEATRRLAKQLEKVSGGKVASLHRNAGRGAPVARLNARRQRA